MSTRTPYAYQNPVYLPEPCVSARTPCVYQNPHESTRTRMCLPEPPYICQKHVCQAVYLVEFRVSGRSPYVYQNRMCLQENPHMFAMYSYQNLILCLPVNPVILT